MARTLDSQPALDGADELDDVVMRTGREPGGHPWLPQAPRAGCLRADPSRRGCGASAKRIDAPPRELELILGGDVLDRIRSGQNPSRFRTRLDDDEHVVLFDEPRSFQHGGNLSFWREYLEDAHSNLPVIVGPP